MITIYKSDGSTLYQLDGIQEGSILRRELMKDDYIQLNFSLSEPVVFPIGSYATTEYGKFVVVSIQKPVYNYETDGYDYTLRLDADHILWNNKIFKFSSSLLGGESSFTLTGNINLFLDVWKNNLTLNGWQYNGSNFTVSVGSEVSDVVKTASFSNIGVIDALTTICELFEVEWWREGGTFHIGRCEKASNVEFSIGTNVEKMESGSSSTTYATRIYAFGSTRNITKGYREGSESSRLVGGIVEKRLMLPSDTPYIDAYEGMPDDEVVEGVVVFDHIYPKRVGTISEVTTYESNAKEEDTGEEVVKTYYRFKDNGLVFSEKYIIEGVTLGATFQTGPLSGLDFDLKFNPLGVSEKDSEENVNPDSQWFEIVVNEDYGLELPTDTLIPRVGNEFVLHGFNVSLVGDTYIPIAERELKEEAEKYIAKTKIDPNVYTCTLDSEYTYNLIGNRNEIPYELGKKVVLRNQAFFNGGQRTSRVIGYEIKLDIPYDSPIYIVGESSSYNRLGTIEKSIDNTKTKVNTLEKRNVKIDLSAYKTWAETLAKLGMTTIEGGYIMSNMLALKDANDNIMAGMNGLYNEEVRGGGAAAWYGGEMDSAKTLFRFDGSGYLASSNIRWNADGSGSIGSNLTWDNNGSVTLASGLKIGDNDTIGNIVNLVNKFGNMFEFVDERGFATDNPQNAIAIRPKNGKGFFSESFISAYGLNSSGGGDSSTVQWNQIEESGKKIAEILIDGVSTSVYAPDGVKAWADITGKPSWIGDAKPTYTASEVGAISSVTSKMVTDALGFTPYNSANFTKANIKSTLGIADWALAESKPTYNLDEVTDGTTRKLSNYLLKSTFDELFEKVTANGVTYIKAKFGLASDDFISAYGVNSGGGSGGGGSVVSYTATITSGSEIGKLTVDGVTKSLYAPSLSGYATQSWVGQQGYLTQHQSLSGYATESWVEGKNYLTSVAYNDLTTKPTSAQIQALVGNYITTFGTKTGAITVRGGLTDNGSVNLAMSNNQLQASIVGLGAMAYKASLAASDIPTLDISKISGLQTALDNKLNKSVFEDLFEKVTENGITYIKAKYGLASVDFISAFGLQSGGSSGGGTNVSFAQTLTSGTEIATITIEGIATKIYAPTPSSAVTWNNLEGKPTWIGDSKPSYTASEVGALESNTTYVSTFGTKSGAITVRGGLTANGSVNLAMSNNQLQASIVGLGAMAYKASLAATDIPNLNWSKITSGKPTTLGGYGITDAKIANGVITLGSNTITPLTSHQSLANYVQTTDSRLSDARNAKDVYAWAKAATKPSYNFSEIGSKPTTISGYGITDAFKNWGGFDIDFNSLGDDNNKNGVLYVHNTWTQTNKPFNYGTIFNVSCGAGNWQLGCSSEHEFMFRSRWWSNSGNAWTSWKTVITSANIGSQSVASAAKLTNSSTLWGQSFDGSGNVSGSLSNVTNISLNGRIYNTEKASTDTLILQGGSGMYLRFNETGIGVADKDWTHTFFLRNNLTYSEITNNVNNIPICFTHGGNVGIGTTTPSSKLHIYQSAWDNGLTLQRSVAGGGASIKCRDGNGTDLGNFGINGVKDFEIQNNSITNVIVKSNGNVGIGTTSPSYPLEVNGNVGISYSSGEVYYKATRSDTSNSIWFGLGSGGTNRGIFSPSNSAWMIYTDGTNTILNCGNVGIGTATPARKFVVSDGGAKGIEIHPTYETNEDYTGYMGNIVAYDRNGKAWKALGLGGSNVQIRTISSGTIKAFTFTNSAFVSPVEVTAYSDARLKGNIKPLCFRGELKPRTFVKDGKDSIGFIAQEVRELYPELVLGNEEDGYLSLNYGAITAILACQTNDHEARIKALENENEELKRKLKMIA